MNKTIRLQGRVAINGGIALSHYHDLSNNPSPTLNGQNVSFRFWFDESCVWGSGTAEQKRRKRPMILESLLCEVLFKVSDEFAAFVLLPLEQRVVNPALLQIYEQHSDQIYDQLFSAANRIVAFLRTAKGQYWIEEFRVDDRKSFGSSFNGAATVHDLTACIVETKCTFVWQPMQRPVVVSKKTEEESKRDLAWEDWESLWSFVQSNNRSNLVLELLTSSEMLSAKGHPRSALIEAVTALETALHAFAKDPSISNIETLSRLDLPTLDKAVEHLGFSQSVRFLLPLLLPREIASNDLLSQAVKAIALRNNVVHTGQRYVDDVVPHLVALRRLSQILLDHTKRRGKK